MTDDPDLDRLKAALRAAEPAPEPARKADALARAMAEFERVQGSAEAARPMSGRPEGGAGFWTGVRAMFATLTSRGALAATASVAAIAFGLVVVLPNSPLPPSGPVLPKATDADVPGVAAPEATGAAVQDRTAVREAAPLAESSVAVAEPVVEPMFAQEAPEADAELYAAPPSPVARLRAEAPMQSAPMAAAPAIGMVTSEAMRQPVQNTEAYANADANPLKVTAEEPVSTFSIDVDTASWAVVRSSLSMGVLPPSEAVRIEEMVNYFPYAWPAPESDGAPFRTTVSVAATPWNDGTRLVTIGLKGRMPAVEDRPPLNLVFLVDTSGSMQDANKLPLLKQSLRLMLPELRPEDQVAIVAYAGSAGEVLAPTSAAERETILAALDRLEAGGSTAGGEGLRLAYGVAERMAAEGEVSRVLLLTDGDFNVGLSDPAELETYIARERESGTYLSVLGFGRGNLDDATMQALAQNGNGTAAYIDTLSEARKVLVDELTGALFPIADDVKIQVEWNPATVAEWRLIGYETRALAREDFNNDRVDAGEIGAGHTVTAIYEITPVGSDARLTDPLRYAAPEVQGAAEEFGFLRLRYKVPGEDTSQLIEAPIPAAVSEPGEDVRFAASIAGMGQLLRDPKYLGAWGWDEAIALATGARGEDAFGYRAEAVQMMRLAQGLSR